MITTFETIRTENIIRYLMNDVNVKMLFWIIYSVEIFILNME